jgi:opacity protein-like surface antigen
LIFPTKSVSIKPLNINIRSFALCLALLLALPLWSQTDGGAPVSELQRKFLQMEQRALELSKRLSEISGTEPIELIDRNESLEPVELETEAQQSYDELPGPLVEPLPIPEEEPVEEVSTVYQSEVVRVVPTTQQRKGDYYIMPLVGFAVSTTTNFSQNNLDDDLEGKWGNSIGVSAGKRWDNWMAYVRVAYQYLENENLNFKNDTNNDYRVFGTEESFSFSLGGGYTISLSQRLSTYGGIGAGFAWRKNNVDVEVKTRGEWRPDPTESSSDSSLVFTYDFSLGLEYLFTQNYSARLGYRLLGLTSNESFDGSFQHLIELGVGANF